MKKSYFSKENLVRFLIGAGLTWLWVWGCQAALLAYQDQGVGVFNQLTNLGKIGQIVFGIVFIIGAITWIINWLAPGKLNTQAHQSAGWMTAGAALLIYTAALLLFIYTATLRILIFSLAAPLVFFGLIGMLKLGINKFHLHSIRQLDLSDLIQGLVLFMLTAALQQFKQAAPIAPFWRTLYYLIAVLNGGLFTAAVFILSDQVPVWIPVRKVISFRNRFRPFIITLITGIVFFLIYQVFWADHDGIAVGTMLRLELILLAGLMIGLLIEQESGKLLSLQSFLAGLGIIGVLVMSAAYLGRVTNYPYSLSWSEGNRFYDYSLIFGKSLYQYDGELNPNYFQPIRYGLWGLPFLIEGLPIWVHRLWNAALYILPGLSLGWVLGKKFRSWQIRLIFVCWSALLLNMGPVYPTLTISLLIIALFKDSNRWLFYAALIAASLFAGLSRFTWVIATGAWAGLIDLFEHYAQRSGIPWKRLAPTLLVIILGSLPGMLVSWPVVFDQSNNYISSQALLWYRLLPSATYPLGILPGTLLAVLPVISLLVLAASTRKWKPDIWQNLAIVVVLLGTFFAGLTASAKIGGGSNLHNMDMFFAVIILVFYYLVMNLQENNTKQIAVSSRMLSGILVILILLPAWAAGWGVRALTLPKPSTITQTMSKITTEIKKAAGSGEILFLDQRQLLTFGNITKVELTADYEKKYVMDMAMAGNKPYFDDFYNDLESKRFGLIISAPVNQAIKTEDDSFGEENNIWVEYVSKPILRSYQAIYLDKRNNIQLLIPKP